MKHGLILPNGRNATGMTTADIEFAKTGVRKQVAMQKKNSVSFEKMLDKWRQFGHTVKSNEKFVLNLRGK